MRQRGQVQCRGISRLKSCERELAARRSEGTSAHREGAELQREREEEVEDMRQGNKWLEGSLANSQQAWAFLRRSVHLEAEGLKETRGEHHIFEEEWSVCTAQLEIAAAELVEPRQVIDATTVRLRQLRAVEKAISERCEAVSEDHLRRSTLAFTAVRTLAADQRRHRSELSSSVASLRS